MGTITAAETDNGAFGSLKSFGYAQAAFLMAFAPVAFVQSSCAVVVGRRVDALLGRRPDGARSRLPRLRPGRYQAKSTKGDE